MVMRLLRAPFCALLSLFLALGAAAGVVRVPSGGYQAGLTALNPEAARAFLADGAARGELRASMPGMYVSSLLRAHEIVALDALPAVHREAFLRRELIAIEALPLQRADTDLPAKHRAEYGSKADARRLARASCAWDTLSPEILGALSKQDVDAKGWATVPISMRAAIIADWWHKRIFEGAAVEPGTPEHLARVRLYARKAGAYLTDQEATELSERIFALERIVKRLPELRAAAGADAALNRELDSVAAKSVDDAPAAKALLDKNFGPAPSKIQRRFVHDARDKAQKAALGALAKKLTAAFRRLAAGTEAEKLIAKGEGRIQVGGVPAGSDGAYQAYTDRLALPADIIDYLLRDRDAQFTDLATNDELVDRLAVMYMPTYVHETTHRLQGRLALKKSLTALEKGMLYGHEDEHEAYLEQELFIREFSSLHPEMAAWARGIPRVEGIWTPSVIARQGKRVSRLYSDVPGGAGRRAQGLLMAIMEANQAIRLKPLIERELRRRARPGYDGSSEAREPVRLSGLDTPARRSATRLLKRWRDVAGTSAALFADRILEYLDEGDARIAALRKRLRPIRRAGR